MKKPNPPARQEIFPDKEFEERKKRASERIKAVLEEEKLDIALPVRFEQGPAGWIKPVASLKFVKKG